MGERVVAIKMLFYASIFLTSLFFLLQVMALDLVKEASDLLHRKKEKYEKEKGLRLVHYVRDFDNG